MKAVSWNCADHLPRKVEAIARLAPDIAIVCEVREQDAGALGEGFQTVWNGAPGQRGLLVATRADWKIGAAVHAARHHLSLVEVMAGGEALSIIGVWAMKGDDGYEGAIIAGLAELLPVAASKQILIAGDFNASAHFDRQHPPSRHFVRIEVALAAHRCRSLWHARSGDAFGAERTPTYYHQWKQTQPFHIDFMFASESLAARLSDIRIGAFEDWCTAHSDHVPIVADFR